MIAAVTAEAYDDVLAAAPDGVEVRRLEDDTSVLETAAFVVPTRNPEALAVLERSTAVQVVQVLSAGTDWIERRLPERVTLCNARGARDIPVAEWVLAALLGATSGLLQSARMQVDRRWDPPPSVELAGSTVLILGAGSIGAAVRERLAPFGVRTIAVARRARDGVHGVDALPGLLGETDALVVLLPLNGGTRGLVDAELLARLPDGALVLNAGRGAVVDTDALHGEVATGRLRAVLDVVDPEPLPPEHPLWTAPGVVTISAHLAGDSDVADGRARRLACEQLARFVRGEPLRNVVERG